MKKYLNHRGFSFIEILSAIVILSAALLPIMTWVPTSIQTKIKSGQKSTAVFLAEGKLEKLYNAILNDFDQDYNQAMGSFPIPFVGFSYSVSDDLDTSLKTITVKVWHKENPKNESIFITQVAKR